MVEHVIDTRFKFESKDKARRYFQELSQLFKTWNSQEFQSDDYKSTEGKLREKIQEAVAEEAAV